MTGAAARTTRIGFVLAFALAWPASGQVFTSNLVLQVGSNIVGRHQQLLIYHDHLAIAFSDSSAQTLYLWVDDGSGGGTADDRIPNGSEIHPVTLCRNSPFGMTVYNDRIAIVFTDTPSSYLKLWCDDGAGGGTAGDFQANGSEIRTIDPVIGNYDPAVIVFNGHLTIGYYKLYDHQVWLWHDDGTGGGTADDLQSTTGEVRIIFNGDYRGNSITTLNGKLALAFAGDDGAWLWYDDGAGGATAGDIAAGGNEVRLLSTDGHEAATTSVGVHDGKLFVAFQDYFWESLMLWSDDGLGGGVAGNATRDGGETRVLDDNGWTGYSTSAGVIHGHLAINYIDEGPEQLHLWVDDGAGPGGIADDGVANGSEIRSLYHNCSQFTALLPVDGGAIIGFHDDDIISPYVGTVDFLIPTQLGPTSFVNGDSGTQAAPTLTFAQNAFDPAAMLNFQIQIDEHGDFSSPIIDYTSELLAVGAASFTVGQPAGGGTYAAGTSGVNLPNGAYSWRIRSVSSGHYGDWVNAISGQAAFVVSVPVTSAGVTVTQTAGTSTISESGDTATFSLVLTRQPTADVVITFTPDIQIDLGAGGGQAATMTFTDGNWSTPQSITIHAVDDAEVEGTHSGIVHIAPSSADADYAALSLADVQFSILDNDSAPAEPEDPPAADSNSNDGHDNTEVANDGASDGGSDSVADGSDATSNDEQVAGSTPEPEPKKSRFLSLCGQGLFPFLCASCIGLVTARRRSGNTQMRR